MIASPQKARKFDPDELMTIGLIKSPKLNTEFFSPTPVARMKDYEKTKHKKFRYDATATEIGDLYMLANDQPTRGNKRRAESDLSSLATKKQRLASPDIAKVALTLDALESSQSFTLKEKAPAKTSSVKSDLCPLFYQSALLYSSPLATANIPAISLTPHPFKKTEVKKKIFTPSSKLCIENVKPFGKVSFRTARSNIAFDRNPFGMMVAVSRGFLLPSGTQTRSSPNVVSSLDMKYTKVDRAKRRITVKEGFCKSSIRKPMLTKAAIPSTQEFFSPGKSRESLHSKDTDTDNEKKGKNATLTDVKSPRILSVTFL